MSKSKRRHLVIPDTQCRHGVPLEHLGWAAKYALHKRPDVIIHLGDHWDFPALSRYDQGTIRAEGKRLIKDLKAGSEGLRIFHDALAEDPTYKPRLVFLEGNHEDRWKRTIAESPFLEGLLEASYDASGLPWDPKALVKHYGWEFQPFLKPIVIDGISYAHYFYALKSGRPYGGNCHYKLGKIKESFTQGHVQELDMAIIDTHRRKLRGLVAGAFYQHKEAYKGHQGNNHWRGIILKTEVKAGFYNLVEASMEFLKERYA